MTINEPDPSVPNDFAIEDADDQVDPSVEPAIASEKSHAATLTKADLILDAALKHRGEDKFGHTEIASIVANLSAYVEMPVNIALFGPWGSGKSSLFSLIKGELKERRNRDKSFPIVMPIKYDAWKFSGTPLKRNFIANAAEQLDLDKDEFRSDLYENRSSLKLPIKKLFWPAKPLLKFVLILIMALVFGSALLASTWALGNMVVKGVWTWDRFWQLEEDHLRSAAKVALIGFIPLLGGLRLIDLAKVTVTRSAPREDEEFQDAFNKLMEHAMERSPGRLKTEWQLFIDDPVRKPWSRVLIFVDELDRCAPDEVLETLIGIKTFLEHPKCVFVVAADRDVLVEALDRGQDDKTRQATPVRQHEPYYSTAGAFLDKMFQHQLEIPTLRRHKLTVFAKGVVEAQQAGIWTEFKTQDLEDVIYTLIPLHVQSPRRVKVLLNAFATTARIADARGVKWRDQPAKIAKLTVLRTEFPRFANDLQLEPRLVKHLEDRERPGSESAQRLRDLYDNYTLGTELAPNPKPAKPLEADNDGTKSPEPLATSASPLIGGAAVQDREAVRRAQITINEHLLDYLEKTKYARITGPNRELLHLEPAGQKEGLTDEALADVIDDAPDRDPAKTMEAFEQAIPQDRAIAASILGAEIDQQVGPGKQIVLEVVCGLVESLDQSDVESIAASIAPAIVRAVGAGHGTSAMVPGALALGAARGHSVALAPVLDRFRALVHDPDNLGDLRLPATADLLPRLSPSDEKTVASIITDGLGRQADEGVIRILATASPDALARYWDDFADDIYEALTSRIASAASAGQPLELADVFNLVLTPLNKRVDPNWDIILDALLRSFHAGTDNYEFVRERASELLPAPGHESAQNDLALGALAVAPLGDWPYWMELVTDEWEETKPVEAALISLIQKIDLVASEDLELLGKAVDQFISMISDDEEGIADEIFESIRKRTEEITWDEHSSRTYTTFDSFLEHFHPEIQVKHDDLSSTEVMRALVLPFVESTNDDIVRYIADGLSDDGARKVLDLLRAKFPDTNLDPQSFRPYAEVQTRCGDVEPIPVTVFEAHRSAAPAIFDRSWLSFRPPIEEVASLYERNVGLDDAAIAEYASKLDDAARTTLWYQLGGMGQPEHVLKKIAAGGVEWPQVKGIFSEAQHGTSDPVRKAAVERLITLPLGGDGLLKETTKLVEALLNSPVKSNVQLAVSLALEAGGAQPKRILIVRQLFNDNADRLTGAKMHSLADIGLGTRPKPSKPFSKLFKRK